MFYTTKEVANLFNYKYQKNLLQALHNNQKKADDKKDVTFSKIWESRKKVGKRFLFKKSNIDVLL
jgi:hypothetical protein